MLNPARCTARSWTGGSRFDLTVGQAAALVGVSERTAYRAAKSGGWADFCIRITGGDIRLATAPLLRQYGLTVGPGRLMATPRTDGEAPDRRRVPAGAADWERSRHG